MDKNQEYHTEIARVAYEIYEKRGIAGFELENWLEAERTVMERMSTQNPPPKKRTSSATASPKNASSKPASPSRPKRVKKPDGEV